MRKQVLIRTVAVELENVKRQIQDLRTDQICNVIHAGEWKKLAK